MIAPSSVTPVPEKGQSGCWFEVRAADGTRLFPPDFVTMLYATAPFSDLWCGIDIHRVDVVSNESGADDAGTCGGGSAGSGAAPRTYLDATSSTNSAAVGIALHEVGHTAFGFADEYEYYAGCWTGEAGRNGYPGGAPFEPNVTAYSDRSTIKWRAVLTAPADALPTTSNANCAQCDTQPNPRPDGYVGACAGARYYHCGASRPSYTCRIRALGNPFCGVCPKTIRDTLTPHLPAAYQALWWNVPGGSESGWGINVAFQKDLIFATWFASFAYTVDGVSQTKQVTRRIYRPPGTLCQ
jgi:hypothetical protein